MHDPAALAAAILDGSELPSAALGRKELYPILNAGANGPLPFLGTSSKIVAGQGYGVLSKVLYMMPADASGREACASRTAGCSAACLAEGTGRMSMSGPQRARRRRHASFCADRKRFLADLHSEIAAHEKAAGKAGKLAAVRLNGTTDLPWHRMSYIDHAGNAHGSLHRAFPGVRFYEYTKHRLAAQSRRQLPPNLHLTFSISEKPGSDLEAAEYLMRGFSAAVVIAAPKHQHPATFNGWPMVDGDAHDARFLDPPGSIVALAAKGRAKADRSGFVRSVAA